MFVWLLQTNKDVEKWLYDCLKCVGTDSNADSTQKALQRVVRMLSDHSYLFLVDIVKNTPQILRYAEPVKYL